MHRTAIWVACIVVVLLVAARLLVWRSEQPPRIVPSPWIPAEMPLVAAVDTDSYGVPLLAYDARAKLLTINASNPSASHGSTASSFTPVHKVVDTGEPPAQYRAYGTDELPAELLATPLIHGWLQARYQSESYAFPAPAMPGARWLGLRGDAGVMCITAVSQVRNQAGRVLLRGGFQPLSARLNLTELALVESHSQRWEPGPGDHDPPGVEYVSFAFPARHRYYLVTDGNDLLYQLLRIADTPPTLPDSAPSGYADYLICSLEDLQRGRPQTPDSISS